MTPGVSPAPHHRDEVLAGLDEAQGLWSAYARSLLPDSFFREPAPGRWSPALHLRHLSLTHGRVTQGLRTPRPALRVLFGRPTTARSYDALRDSYRAQLAAGGQAPARYVPRPAAQQDAAAQAEILAAYLHSAAALRLALAAWPDEALDTHAFPHDLLGRVSGRELAFFTLYHDLHHLRGLTAQETP